MQSLLASPQTIADACLHLTTHDAVMAELIRTYDPCSIRPHDHYYQELVESIIGQQLSVKAAATIRTRFVAIFQDSFPDATTIATADPMVLRKAGLSGAKVRYVQDLARRVANHEIDFDSFDQLSNDEITAILTTVHGIGEWTAHMFLLFCMGRLTVLAHGDLGVRTAIKNCYGLPTLPSSHEVQLIAMEHGWSPYQSVACWYLWRSLDNN